MGDLQTETLEYCTIVSFRLYHRAFVRLNNIPQRYPYDILHKTWKSEGNVPRRAQLCSSIPKCSCLHVCYVHVDYLGLPIFVYCKMDY